MKYKSARGGHISGELEILVAHHEEDFDGEQLKWEEVLIHGNPEGLKSLAKLLMELPN